MRVACHRKFLCRVRNNSRSQFLRRSALDQRCAPNPVNPIILQILIQTINHVASPDNVSGSYGGSNLGFVPTKQITAASTKLHATSTSGRENSTGLDDSEPH